MSSQGFRYDNYVFDLYGTLVDLHVDEQSAHAWKTWLKWLDAHGISKHPDYLAFRKDFFELDAAYREKMIAEGPYTHPEIDILDVYRELFERYGNRNISEELLAEASYAFREATREYIRLFPGVEAFLNRIHEVGKKAYILSNAQASYTMPEIKLLGLDKLVDGIHLSSDYKCMKPEKDFFFGLMKEYLLIPDKTVMIGDNPEADVEGAKGAMINGILLQGPIAPDVFYLDCISFL